MSLYVAFVGALSGALSVPARAQSSPSTLHVGDVAITGSLRTRVESWNWFGHSEGGEYTYPGSLFRIAFSQSTRRVDWQAEAAMPVVLGLPPDAVVPGAQGALGLGANYFAANGTHSNAAQLFVKQAFVRVRNLGGVTGQSLKIGRFEFIDGTETTPADRTLASLKRDRIAHRLVGNFSFSHVGRSLDGAQYGLDTRGWNVAAVAARPTRGVFDVNGWSDLNVTLIYGAVTRGAGTSGSAAEWRAFTVRYVDHRDVAKVDNRLAAVRSRDLAEIDVSTFGGHYLATRQTAGGPVDLLLWGAVQRGSWGELRHRAGALSIEGGWQPRLALAPWLRGGWNYGSGDGNAADGTHATFFQLLPTPRVYARLPFFNMMNTSDAFGEIVLRPGAITIRGDVHDIRLANRNDLWYQGGGAFQPATFGYAGRPSNGSTSLATLYDVSADVSVSPNVGVVAYLGYAAGRRVTDAIYGGGGTRLGYAELTLRF